MAERFRNQGYATKAVRLLVEDLLAQTEVVAVNAVALDGNGASNKLIQKSGLPHVGLVDIDREPHHHYQRVR